MALSSFSTVQTSPVLLAKICWSLGSPVTLSEPSSMIESVSYMKIRASNPESARKLISKLLTHRRRRQADLKWSMHIQLRCVDTVSS